MRTTEFRVPDATCGHCKMTIEAAVTALEGVSTVDLDLDSKRLRVEHEDAVDEGALSASISAAGYTPQTPTR